MAMATIPHMLNKRTSPSPVILAEAVGSGGGRRGGSSHCHRAASRSCCAPLLPRAPLLQRHAIERAAGALEAMGMGCHCRAAASAAAGSRRQRRQARRIRRQGHPGLCCSALDRPSPPSKRKRGTLAQRAERRPWLVTGSPVPAAAASGQHWKVAEGNVWVASTPVSSQANALPGAGAKLHGQVKVAARAAMCLSSDR